jgi:glycosyltransferase involved in cell wall biosynthesis
MIILDFYRINNGGGLNLMNILIDELKYNPSIILLIDKRNIDFKNQKNFNFKIISNEFERNFFLYHNRNNIKKLFSFGNIPPLIKLKSETYVYFHQMLYFEKLFINNKFNKYYILLFIINYFNNNVNYWIFQTNNTSEQFLSRIKLNISNKTLIIPFFKSIINQNKHITKEKNTFFYPTSISIHKNNIILINAFIDFYINNKIGKLFITLNSKDFLNNEILKKIFDNNVPIFFLGKLNKNDIIKTYEISEFVIHPSATESFGLVLIESCLMDCKLIAPDFEYVNEIVLPSLSFKKISYNEIYKSFSYATLNPLPKSKLLVENKISLLLDLIQK